MIKQVSTLTGKVTIAIPEKISNLTLGQLMQLQSAKRLTDLEAISILSMVPLIELQNIRNASDLDSLHQHILAMSRQIPHLFNSGALPSAVTFKIDNEPVKVKVIKNLSVEPAGAFMAAREIIADEIAKHVAQYGEADWQEHYSPSLSACAQVLAQYFYCRATGNTYNEYAAAEFEEQVKLLPVTDALPISKYFFLSYPNLSRPKTGFWPRLQRLWSSARG